MGYGCTTCIGNSGDIHEAVAAAISENGILLIVIILILALIIWVIYSYFDLAFWQI